MEASRKTVSIGLESVTKSGLRDALLPTHLANQSVEIRMEVLVDLGHVVRHDGREQHATETGCGIDWQDEVAEG